MTIDVPPSGGDSRRAITVSDQASTERPTWSQRRHASLGDL